MIGDGHSFPGLHQDYVMELTSCPCVVSTEAILEMSD